MPVKLPTAATVWSWSVVILFLLPAAGCSSGNSSSPPFDASALEREGGDEHSVEVAAGTDTLEVVSAPSPDTSLDTESPASDVDVSAGDPEPELGDCLLPSPLNFNMTRFRSVRLSDHGFSDGLDLKEDEPACSPAGMCQNAMPNTLGKTWAKVGYLDALNEALSDLVTNSSSGFALFFLDGCEGLELAAGPVREFDCGGWDEEPPCTCLDPLSMNPLTCQFSLVTQVNELSAVHASVGCQECIGRLGFEDPHAKGPFDETLYALKGQFMLTGQQGYCVDPFLVRGRIGFSLTLDALGRLICALATDGWLGPLCCGCSLAHLEPLLDDDCHLDGTPDCISLVLEATFKRVEALDFCAE